MRLVPRSPAGCPLQAQLPYDACWRSGSSGRRTTFRPEQRRRELDDPWWRALDAPNDYNEWIANYYDPEDWERAESAVYAWLTIRSPLIP